MIDVDKKLALFYFAYRSFVKPSDNLLGRYGITQFHRRILFFVARKPGMTVNELLSVLDVSKQAMHKPMQELIAKGMIDFQPHPKDKRSKVLFLTSGGLSIDNQISQIQIEKMDAVFNEAGDPGGRVWEKVMEIYARDEAGAFFHS
ncbi:MAG: Multiple antibiotic resistance protein MarR [Candidatus Erwinia impunctatus]|nr:Multiple antibiotic resistance protein MarR [Culicoides impunctatus]